MNAWPLTVDAAKKAAASVLFIVFISAVWIETDAYRVVGVVLLAWACLTYLHSDREVCMGWMGYACIGWSAYVAIRYIVAYRWGGLQSHGASEGIYLLPFVYMTLAYLMFAYRDVLDRTALLFIAASFVMALFTIDLVGSFDGGKHEFFRTNNRIHSSVGAGFIILAAINVAAYAARTARDARTRWAVEALCHGTVGLCLIGLFGAKSKGVWAAIAIAACLQVVLSFRSALGRRALLSGTVLLAAAAAFILVFHAALWKTLAPTLDGLSAVVWQALASSDPAMAVRESISVGGLPRGTYLRLMMWYNAVQVWSQNIIFGNGIGWKDLYEKSTYNYVGFDIVHNGYFEIGMRYGLVGIAFFVALYAWTIAIAKKALKHGLIAPEAFNFHVVALVFFAVTIVTNSNNRLAIGESYMAAAAAFGFFCLYMLQAQRRRHIDGAEVGTMSSASAAVRSAGGKSLPADQT